jgi:D-glycero-D-manno-heptose 1,7-bisphosphate phosphatase
VRKRPDAVFLDRDGTVMEDAHYIKSPNQVRLLPGAARAVRRINEAGIPAIVVTNQSGIDRGIFTVADYEAVKAQFESLLHEEGARIDASYYCPHHPEAVIERYRQSCECRKPQPGLLRQAASDLDIALDRSFVVGDRWHDLEAGQRVGARGVLVRTGYGKTEERAPHDRVKPAAIVDNLMEAVSWILRAS